MAASMVYLIPIILVILLIGGFVIFLVMNATRKSDVSDADDPGREQNPLGIIGSDDSPAGDTTEHAGEQEGGSTVGGQDAASHGGTGGPVHSGSAGAGFDGEHEADENHTARPVVGGEAEGERRVP